MRVRKIYIVVSYFTNMYQVGKYEYESKMKYEFLLIKVIIVFAVLFVLLNILRNGMYEFVYYGCVTICILMMIHLWMRFMHAEGICNYIFNKY